MLRIIVLTVIVPFFCGAADDDESDDFQVQINVENGHLGKLFFGCEKDASEKYDRGQDIMSPPPGRGTGYTVFMVPEHKLRLYKDIRKLKRRNTWQLYAQVYKDDPVKLSWNPDKLPKNRFFYIQKGGKNQVQENNKAKAKKEKKFNMRKKNSLTVGTTSTVTIIATKK